jgi:hypothetical protein
MATRTATHGASAKDPELLAVIQGWCKDVGIKKNSARARAPVIVAAEDPDVLALIEERGTVPAGKKAGINKNSASAPVLDGSFFALTRQVSTLETENAALKRALAHAREDAAAYAEVAGELEEDCKAKGEEAERCAKSAADALARLAVAEAAIAELKAQRALAASSPAIEDQAPEQTTGLEKDGGRSVGTEPAPDRRGFFKQLAKTINAQRQAAEDSRGAHKQTTAAPKTGNAPWHTPCEPKCEREQSQFLLEHKIKAQRQRNLQDTVQGDLDDVLVAQRASSSASQILHSVRDLSVWQDHEKSYTHGYARRACTTR